jgi:hypothetical protein
VKAGVTSAALQFHRAVGRRLLTSCLRRPFDRETILKSLLMGYVAHVAFGG